MAEAMSAKQRAPLALTMGDPCGIGPEITLKAWSQRQSHGVEPFVLLADPVVMARRASELNYDIPFEQIEAPAEASSVFARALPILPPDISVQTCDPGQPTPENTASVIAGIDMAVDFALSGQVSAVVTNPIAKAILAGAGFGFRGHTEYLGVLTKRRGANATPIMMLVGGGLRTVSVTVHIPLREVPEALTAERIIEAGLITHRALIEEFGIAEPRLAVTGLNPHAGEDGAMGTEERDVIDPATAVLTAQGVNVIGPLSADTAFHAAARAGYDACLAMYHDQALIPVKTLAFDEGVNVTLGLPFVRTSPDHGTAFDIAGTGKARPDSLISALKLASEMAQTRAARGEALT